MIHFHTEHLDFSIKLYSTSVIYTCILSFRGVRPFGVSLLIAGWDNDRPYLFQCDPSGAYFAWKATAMGKNFINGKTFLEKRFVIECSTIFCAL